jgi:3-methyladenine DNA glycosylase AlkD
MNVSTVLSALEAKGKPATAQVYRRHGAFGTTWGVSTADLDALAKKLKTQHALALQLFDSGVHEARILATKIADPEQVTSRLLTTWLGKAGNYVVVDAIASLAAKTTGALGLARDFVKSGHEWTAAAGWSIFCLAALDRRLDESEAKRLIATIRRDIHRQPNRVRHTMNDALIAIGGGMPQLSELAIAAARAIGHVEVDHGDTGCVTPAAGPYIEKMLARKSRESAGARASSGRSNAAKARSSSTGASARKRRSD